MTIASAAGAGSELTWFKSSHSTNDGPSCVEIATTPATIHIRDSKDTLRPSLTFAPRPWTAFLTYAGACRGRGAVGGA